MGELSYYQARVPGLRREGGEYRAKCPLHGGTTDTSFALDPKTWRWFCHGACGEGGDAIKLEQALHRLPFREAKRSVEEAMGTISDDPVPISRARKPAGKVVATYRYHDAAGALVYEVVRFEPKDFRQRRPDGDGGWVWNLRGVEPTLYRLPELLGGPDVVHIAEGEKDVDALRALGLNATCNSGGAKKFTAAMAKLLAGRPVVILPDDDAAGRAHAEQVGTLLRIEGCRVKIVQLPAKDPADWLAAGGTFEALVALQSATPEWGGVLTVREDAPPDEWPAPSRDLPANLHEMLKTYVVLVGTDQVFCRRTGRTLTHAALKNAHGKDAKAWAEEPDRLAVDADRVVFKPEGAAPGELNLFRGLPALSVHEGDVDAWFQHLRFMCGEEKLAGWAISRLAYKVQHPEVKIGTSLVFHGRPGTGKNLLFKPLLAIFGDYGREVGQAQVDGQYTDWLSGKLLLVADEVAGHSAGRGVKNRLKALITSDQLVINAKFAPTRWERNCTDLHFLSNEDVPVALDVDDRRFCIIRCDTVQDAAYYRRLAAVDPGALKQALLAWDCSGFDPFGLPPDTAAKAAVTTLVKESADRFLDDWLGGQLPVPPRPAVAADLYKAYDTWAKTHGEMANRTNAVMFGRRAASRLHQHVVWFGNTSRRVWHKDDAKPTALETEDFARALEAWLKAEQRSKL